MTIDSQVKKKAFERLFPQADPFTHDPVGWVRKKCKRFVWSKQVEIMESVRDNRYTAVPSCHGPGKSFTASCIAGWWIDSHPPGQAFVITTAPTDSQVKAVLWREIRRRHRESKMPGRITLEAHWYNGERQTEDELVGLGRKPQDYDADAFQGIHAKYVLVLVDEACGVPKNLFDALETLMTNDFARMLAIGNPTDPTAYFRNICRPGSGWNTIPISAFDTPNFTGEYVPKSVAEDLVTPLWVEERAQKWGVTSPLYVSRVEGRFPDISDDTLISPAHIEAAMQRTLPGVGLGIYGADIARFGIDETAVYRNRDGKVRLVHNKHKQDTVETTSALKHLLNQSPMSYIPMVVDVIGVGGGVVDMLRHDNYNVIPFNGSESPWDPVRFGNRRAEAYWNMRELFEGGKVDLDPNDETLLAQLGALKWKLTRRGQILIESKEEIKRRGLPSPDRADSVMMALSAMNNVISGAPQIIMIPTITSDLLKRAM